MASRPGAAGAAGGGPKKMVVKTLKRSTELSEDFVDTTWRMLADFIRAVQNLQFTNHSFEELYRGVEALVVAKKGADTYARLRGSVSTHIERCVAGLAMHSQDARSFLAAVAKVWGEHTNQIVMLRSVFLYLDTTYVRDAASGAGSAAPATNHGTSASQPVQPLWEMGISIFQNQLLTMHQDLLHRILDAFCTQMNADRDGEMVDRSVLSAVSKMLATLRLYESHLRPAIVIASREYYQAEGLAKQATMDVPLYLSHVEDRIRQEITVQRERVLSYLDPLTTLKPVLHALESQLLARHASSLLDRGFVTMVQHAMTRLADLKRFYSLMFRVDKVEDMRKLFAEFVKRQAMTIVENPDNNEEKDKTLVPALLDLKANMDCLLAQCFGDSDGFATAIRHALEEAINTRNNKPAELIAKYVDQKMRAGARATASASSGASAGATAIAADEDLDELLGRVMYLFRCIHGKDVFEAFYKKDLAKRLLLGRSASTDAEKAMIARLKTECGSAFTSKLEGMFKDADASAELMRQFQGSPYSEGLPFDLTVHVLTSAYWPAYPAIRVNLPAQLAAGLEAFSSFYLTKFSKGRTLQWQHSLGHCIVKAVFPSGRKELDVSFFQALVLLMFNDADSVPFLRIKEVTGIEDGELRRTLQSLALGQVRVLRKEPKGKEVEDADVFHFNSEFKAALIRLKINTIQLKETKQEVDATHEQVIADRQYQIDAAIVRIMKARKTLTHQQLLSELFGMLRFPAKAADIKPRIESLLDREYLERDEGDVNTYHYVA